MLFILMFVENLLQYDAIHVFNYGSEPFLIQRIILSPTGKFLLFLGFVR